VEHVRHLGHLVSLTLLRFLEYTKFCMIAQALTVILLIHQYFVHAQGMLAFLKEASYRQAIPNLEKHVALD
jgi:hypothetical protein